MKMSWPLPASTSAKARPRTSSTGIRSTVTLVLFFLPHSGAISFTNHSSNSGRKCAHFAILRVLKPANAPGVNTENGPATAAPATSLIKSRRETLLPFGWDTLVTSKTPFPRRGVGLARGLNFVKSLNHLLQTGGRFRRHLRLLRRRQLIRKFPEELQAQEIRGQSRVLRQPVGVEYLIRERVQCDGAGPRIRKGRANQEYRPSVAAVHVFFRFGSAASRLELNVEFIGGQDDGRSIGSEAVLGANGMVYRATGRIVGRRSLPEVGKDPRAQQVVAEIAKWSADRVGPQTERCYRCHPWRCDWWRISNPAGGSEWQHQRRLGH